MYKKTVAITGASRGIGKSIALKYAKEGYDVAICCQKNMQALELVKKEILSYGRDCITYMGNIGDYSQAKAFFEEINTHWGHLDILINNAGISKIGLLQDMSIEEWNEILQANLTSVFCCCKLSIPMMLQQKSGKIFNISSVWGCTGASMEVAYSATKGGINTFTQALAKELGPSNIQVNAIACGIIDTSMNQFLSEEELGVILEEIPVGRLGTPNEVANLVYSLSESGDYLTGQVIKLDGGWI